VFFVPPLTRGARGVLRCCYIMNPHIKQWDFLIANRRIRVSGYNLKI